MNKELTIRNYNRANVTDSREVAEMIGKAHDKLLRDIRGYIEIISHSPKLGSESFFIKSEYINSRNQKQPCYLLTKQGCEMVANKMTGEKGILFTAEYVQAFNKMEEVIREVKKETNKIEPTTADEINKLLSCIPDNQKGEYMLKLVDKFYTSEAVKEPKKVDNSSNKPIGS